MLQSEIVGTVKMRCYLTGMPELRLGLNDKILFESTGRKWIHTVYLFSIELASLTFSAIISTYVAKISSFWVYAIIISKQEIEQLGSPVGSVSLLFPMHEWKLSI